MTGAGVSRLLRHRVLCGLIVGLLLAAVGGAYVVTRPTSYTATAIVALSPRPEAPAPADMVVLVASSYEAFLSSAELATTVAAEFGLSRQAVASATSVVLEPDSANLRIEVKLPSAELAAATANSLAAMTAARADQNRLVVADVVAPALARTVEVNPPRLLLLVITAAGAVLAGSVIWYLLRYRGPARGRGWQEGER